MTTTMIASATSASRAPSPGDLVDRRYRVRREIAVGGMARVLEAEHVHLGGRVALKVPLPELLHDTSVRLRLVREGQALRRVQSSGVPIVYDAAVDPSTDLAFLAMEMVDGKSLDGLLAARGRLDVRAATALTLQLCETLARCHDAAVLHRDIKPSNVIVHRDEGGLERPKLIDFGIAALGALAAEVAPTKLTHQDEIIGTVEYMAPEQLASGSLDARTDVWALGVTLFEMLSGEVPFTGSRLEVIAHVVGGARVPALHGRVPGVPPALDALLARATALSPSDRFPDTRALAASLAGMLEARPEDVRLLPSTAAATGREARRHARAAYSTPVRITYDDAVADGRSEDISENGLLAVLRRPIAVGARVEARLCLPTSGRAATITATVRWCRAGRGAYALGLELVSASDASLTDIRTYVGLVGEQ